MALTPQTDVAFLREVDEGVRLDAAARFWKRWSRMLIGAVVVALAALAGSLWWTSHTQALAGTQGETLSAALRELTSNNPKPARAKLTDLASSRTQGYAAAARLALAADKVSANDMRGAAAAYGSVASDTALAQPFRDLATIRQVAAQFDSMPPANVVAQLRPLAVPGKPWFGSAGEMTAVALMRMNKTADAGAMFAAVAKDASVPDTVRSRTAQMASSLGVAVPPPADRGRN